MPGVDGLDVGAPGVCELGGWPGCGSGCEAGCEAAGVDASGICALDACAISVRAFGGCTSGAGEPCADTSGGLRSGVPADPAISLMRPDSVSPSAEKQGPDATSSNTSGACRRIRRLDGATAVQDC
ncbi:hypothetical protein QZM93_04820 [Burkholderia cepacia]|uniref:hypothetical protein n=1 Tax=Burkholderia cepacia TaxID=292 RepID=UPI0026512743|nr:hypothetical protein [Burkholderia cepacia]MDN7887929.1 hypothetical protein [Burkholderia cepacia]